MKHMMEPSFWLVIVVVPSEEVAMVSVPLEVVVVVMEASGELAREEGAEEREVEEE